MRHGFLLVDKPRGPTSHDVVAAVRRVLSERKIGHLGTLDPAASGLLVLAVGAKALRVVEFFMGLPKEYEAEVTFGAVSTTYDADGTIERIEPKPGWGVPSEEDVRRVIRDRFLGRIAQVPPAYSAVKVGGERAYRKMRQGKSVQLPERSVQITVCDILTYVYPVLKLRVACGAGTYIRSLAHDLGTELRCGGDLSALRRTRVGEWAVAGALAPERVTWTDVTPLKEIMKPFPRLDLNDREALAVKQGRDIDGVLLSEVIGWYEGLPVAILEPVMGGVHARKVL